MAHKWERQLIVLVLIMFHNTSTQSEPALEPNQQELMQMMGPMLETMAKPYTAKQLTRFSKNYYDALIAKGFTKEEAIQIVTAVGMPAIPSMK